MIKLLFLFLIPVVFISAQQKAISPFSIEDYKNMKNEYLKTAAEKKDHLLYLKNTYYSTQKLDSLLVIKDQIKRQYWIDNGKKAEEITEENLQQLRDEFLLPQSILKIKNNGNTFYLIDDNDSPQLFIETKDGKSINFIFNDSDYTERIQDYHSKLNTENYYYPNHQLKKTSTIFNNVQNTGVVLEYDSLGKLTNKVDWIKDFPIPQKQIESIAQKEVLNFLSNTYKDNPELISLFIKTDIRVSKILYYWKQPAWFFECRSVKGVIDAKTGKLVQIKEELLAG